MEADVRARGGGGSPLPPFPSSLLPSFPHPLPSPSLSPSLPSPLLPSPLPLGRSRPLNPARGLGSSVSSPSVVGAPAKIEFV